MTTRLEVICEIQEELQRAYALFDDDSAYAREYAWHIEYLEDCLNDFNAMTDEEFAASQKLRP